MPRLDRHLSKQFDIKRSDARRLLAQGRVQVNGITARDISQRINRFSVVKWDGMTVSSVTARYLMLNKPAGVVSATVDNKHSTVIDLLTQPWKDQLHIVGRLDFNSTGLMLLTNDGQWSRRLSLPASHLPKHYHVTLDKAPSRDAIDAFRSGIYFKYEGITTRPARLRMLGELEAEVDLTEGRYHQIKRMFGQFGIKVLSIHRLAVGPLILDPLLNPGGSRQLTAEELASLAQHSHQASS